MPDLEGAMALRTVGQCVPVLLPEQSEVVIHTFQYTPAHLVILDKAANCLHLLLKGHSVGR